MSLSSVGNVVSHKKGFAFKSRDYSQFGTPLVKVSDFDSDTVSKSSTLLPESFLEKYADWRIKKGDILIATVGSWGSNPNSVVGKVVRVMESMEGALLNQNAVRLRTGEKCDQRFLFYCLKKNDFKEYCLNSAQGSANQASITLSDIKNFPIPNHSEETQKAIAHILGTLDDKIELNQKMNQTLEEIAKAIFKSWFVNFDPVRAKAEGCSTGLPHEISDLFPDELVDSEIGEIPKGWEVTIVSDFGKVVCGKTPSTKDPENFEGEFPFITIPDMRGNLINLSTERSVSEKGATVLKGKMLPAGSICISCIATPGLVSITSCDSFTNQQINSIVPADEVDKEYLLFSMMTFGDLISSAGSGGSVFANLSTGRFKELPILRANEKLRSAFSRVIRPILQRIELSQKEIYTLSELRDTLLPKLISGELRIPDAEKFFEEAGI
jgi:type I restriction enzyme S subunit